jgi:hypothetical protein
LDALADRRKAALEVAGKVELVSRTRSTACAAIVGSTVDALARATEDAYAFRSERLHPPRVTRPGGLAIRRRGPRGPLWRGAAHCDER